MAKPEEEEAHPYVLTNEIGKGSFATVFRGYHVKKRTAVAVKTISRAILTTKLLDNLESEISILKALNHRHITALKDIVKAERNIYIVMEYCSGGDLSNYIRVRGKVESLQYIPEPGAAPIYYPHAKSGGLDRKIVRSFLRQLTDALKFMRDRNLIHRDLKPQNLLLQPASDEEIAHGHMVGAPVLKVADFGFARFLPNATMAETLCGSPLYMAPEILSYEKYDAKADLWSVGAVLYEMSVGRPPFRANNHIELLNKINKANNRVPFPDEATPKPGANPLIPVPADIKALIRMLLKRNPVERAAFEDFFKAEALIGQPEYGWSAANSTVSVPKPEATHVPSPQETTPEPAAPQASRPSPSFTPSSRKFAPVTTNSPTPGDWPIGPDGQPYNPELYSFQSTFHFRRRKHHHRDKDRDKERKSREKDKGKGKDVGSEGSVDAKSVSSRRSEKGDLLITSAEVDGVLRTDYVLVDDTRAVEFNRVADEIAQVRASPPMGRTRTSTSSARPNTFRRITSRAVNVPPNENEPAERPPSPPSSHPESVLPDEPTKPPHPTSTGPPPPFATTYRPGSDAREFTFPPPPPQISNGTTHATPLLIKPPANALARALNVASKRLFGSPTDLGMASPGRTTAGPSTQAQAQLQRESNVPPASTGAGTTATPPTAQSPLEGVSDNVSEIVTGIDGLPPWGGAEDELLGQLEAIAQKAHVLSDWADKKFEKVKATPSKPIPSSLSFVARKGEAPHRAESRRKRESEIETHAMQGISLYMSVMSFAQKAIDMISSYYKEKSTSTPSPGVDDAMNWATETFTRSMDQVHTLKTWLPVGLKIPPMWIDRIIYDYALSLLRHAASRELLAENFHQCEEEYERALWMLYAIQDDVIQAGNPYAEQDRKTISTFMATTRTRLAKLRKRLAAIENGTHGSGPAVGSAPARAVDAGASSPASRPPALPRTSGGLVTT